MKDKCNACGEEAELITTQDYWGDDMFLCEDCYKEAEIRADREQERYKEERRFRDGISNR